VKGRVAVAEPFGIKGRFSWLEQAATVMQEAIDAIEGGELLGMEILLALELQLDRLHGLFEGDQSPRECCHGLGKILSGAADAEGDRFGGHGWSASGLMTTHKPTQLKRTGLDRLPPSTDRNRSIVLAMFRRARAPMAQTRILAGGGQGWLTGFAALAASLGLAVGLSGSTARAESNPGSAGAKGAQVYCFMRAAGNDHEVSWAAAYSLIKRQSASLFKTSPEHAAVMITETVVQSPTSYPDCGRFLGDLFIRPSTPSRGGDSSTPTPPDAGVNPIQTRTNRSAN
jgi:hypothetical protein